MPGALHIAVDGAGDNAGIVQAARHGLKTAENACAEFGVLQRFFVEKRPEYYGRVIAVALYKRAQIGDIFFARLETTVFVHDDKTHFVARVQNFLGRRIMRAAIGVCAKLF